MPIIAGGTRQPVPRTHPWRRDILRGAALLRCALARAMVLGVAYLILFIFVTVGLVIAAVVLR